MDTLCEIDLDGNLIETSFRDLPNDTANSWNLIKSHKSKDHANAMNFYGHPSIKCFYVASTHLDNGGSVPFQHILNYLDSTFLSLNANFGKSLSFRSYFFSICDRQLIHELGSSVLLNDSGLLLLTCKQHDRGASLQMIYVVRDPLVGNLSHSYRNRLAPAASSLRETTPLKVGHFPKTWSISKCVAGKDRAASLVLHSTEFFAKSQSLVQDFESKFFNSRTDMVENDLLTNRSRQSTSWVVTVCLLHFHFIKSCFSFTLIIHLYNPLRYK